MVKLVLTKMQLQFLIMAADHERHSSEEVGVPLERLELEALRKLYRARDKAYKHGPEVTAEWQRELASAPTPMSERVVGGGHIP